MSPKTTIMDIVVFIVYLGGAPRFFFWVIKCCTFSYGLAKKFEWKDA
jgi:hypothetical protein